MLRFGSDFLAVNRTVILEMNVALAKGYEPVFNGLGELIVFLLLVFLL